MPPRMPAPQRQSAWPPHVETRAVSKSLPTPAANSGVQGVWENGKFRFHSPEAAEAWQRAAYRQGISADNWHQGQEVDDKTRDLAQANLGGPMPAMYQGPDGKHRFANFRTIEDKEVRDHRLQHIRGKTIDQIAAAKMPGEDELVAKRRVNMPPPNAAQPQPIPAGQFVAAANDNEVAPVVQSTKPVSPVRSDAPNAGVGRFAGMPKALAESGAGEDEARLFMQGLSGDTADYGRAALTATGKWWDGEEWSDAYAYALIEEEEKTEEVRKRLGIKGIAIEAAPGFIPIVGDIAGAVSDAKDLIQNGDDWGWKDYGLIAAGTLPWIPNRGVVKKGEKAVEEILQDGKSARRAGDEVADLAESNAIRTVGAPKPNLDEYGPNTKTKIHTEAEALNLAGQNRGLIYVLESEPAQKHAAWYQGETPGSFWSVEHQKPVVPALRCDNPEGVNFVKFDGIEKAEDGDYLILIDSKAKIDPPIEQAREGLKATLKRVGSALKQNNDPKLNGPKFKIFYDFPSEEKAKEAFDVIKAFGYSDVITVRVRQASKLGQERFKQLREK